MQARTDPAFLPLGFPSTLPLCPVGSFGDHITTPEESAKYLEMAKKYFKVKPRTM